MASQQLLVALNTHTQTISQGFHQAAGTEKERIAALLKEAQKINIHLEKLIVLERLGKRRQAETLQDKIETAIGLLELHMEQTL
jgi:hypothetical protein